MKFEDFEIEGEDFAAMLEESEKNTETNSVTDGEIVLIGDENLATNCSDSLEDYLSMRLEDNILSVTLNDIRFSPINLPSDTLAQFTQGGVELVSYQTNAKFYFISLTGRE